MFTRIWSGLATNARAHSDAPRMMRVRSAAVRAGAVAAALCVAVAALCAGATILRAQTTPAAPAAPPASPAAEKQDLVRKWFGAASTLDFVDLSTLTDKGSSEKFKRAADGVPDLIKLREGPEFQDLKKRVAEMLPQVLEVGEPVAEGDSEAAVPISLNEAKLPQWIELRELISAFVDESARGKGAKTLTLTELAEKRKASDPNYEQNLKRTTANLIKQSKQTPRAWLVQEQGAWKINLTRMEKEAREAAAAAAPASAKN